MELRSKGFEVYLKNISREDADEIADNANDYEIAYNIAQLGTFPHPYHREDALRFVARAEQERMNGMGVHFGIHLVDGRTLIGGIGLKNIDANNRKCEIGYWMGKNYRRMGYTTQALKLLLAFGFGRLRMNRIGAQVLGFNEKSMSLLENLGFSREGKVRESVLHGDAFVDEVSFGMLAKDYNDSTKIEIGGD